MHRSKRGHTLVRFGSEADSHGGTGDVRLTPESGHPICAFLVSTRPNRVTKRRHRNRSPLLKILFDNLRQPNSCVQQLLLHDGQRVLNVDAGVFAQITETRKAQLNIENIFNKGYWASADGNNNLSPGQPRTYRLKVTAKL